MSGAHEQPPLTGQREQGVRFDLGLDERLLDVHMRPGEQRLPGGLEVHSRRRTDVHDIGPSLREQLGQGSVSRAAAAPGEGVHRFGPNVMDAHDGVRCRDALQRAEMQPGHVAGADERDSQGSGAGHRRAHCAGLCWATALTRNSLTPRTALMRARSSGAARSSRRATA